MRVPFDPPLSTAELPAWPDPVTGGFWTATRRDSLVRVWPDGQQDEIVEVVRGGVTMPFPALARIRVAADGTFAWGITSFPPSYAYPEELLRLDLRSDPPIAVLVTDMGAVYANEYAWWEPSWPSGEELLLVRGAGDRVERMGIDASPQTELELPGEGSVVYGIGRDGAAARSPRRTTRCPGASSAARGGSSRTGR